MCSHYQTLKDAELLLKKFGAPNKPARRSGWSSSCPRGLRRLAHRAGGCDTVFDDWIKQIHAEPCVIERDQVTRELLDVPGRPRKGMGPR